METWLPEAASSFAGDIDRLIFRITLIVGIWFLAAELVLFFFLGRSWWRKKKGLPPLENKENPWVVLIPGALVLVCDLAVDAYGTPVWKKIKETLPPAAYEVRVTGKQFLWECTHPGLDGQLGTADDVLLLNELHVPVDETVRFYLEAKDVLHSLWVPPFRLKQDAVPGRTIQGWFEATKTGEYPLACAELCGIGHGNMKGKVVVHSKTELRNFFEKRPWEE